MDNKELDFLNFANLAEMERLYHNYLRDPSSVDPTLIYFFKGMELSQNGCLIQEDRSLKVFRLIEAYRRYGHLKAHLNPVAFDRQENSNFLSLERLGFKKEDLNESFPTQGLLKEKEASLKKIIDRLESIYCQFIGIESDLPLRPEVEQFIFEQIEGPFQDPIDPKEKMEILEELHRAEAFEAFIQLRYPGQKRFSIEGGESFIPLLKKMIQEAKTHDVKEILIGMAHRGRLNVLANVLNKPLEEIFSEFEPKSKNVQEGLSGDVKYHKGYQFCDQNFKITLCPNPSHLEAVSPVVMGRARATQLKLKNLQTVLPILIHGDAAIAGQGIVYETLQMDQLEGFQNGGVIHLVINNQIGFTAKSEEGRSTLYCTDIAKTFGLPVFHVNGEDPEGCIKVAKLALAIRQKFQISVFIDYNCYRKYGHNETDEPRFTQPKLYDLIHKKDSIFTLYQKKLLEEKVIFEDQKQQIVETFKQLLDQAHQDLKNTVLKESQIHQNEPNPPILDTKIPEEPLRVIAEKLSRIPEDFQIHPKLKKMVQERVHQFEQSKQNKTLDFAFCEQLAYASLLKENVEIRIVGEDSRRGTFSHRHAVLIDQQTENPYYQLNHLFPVQGQFSVYNSFLSEYAAMGYEYGFSVENAQALVIWEAQFGDFSNCAQVIIDQFLVAGYQKWSEASSLVLLLPHGYEGMGPEHSSARIERFMQMAAQNNMEIVYPTFASQMFHLFRHQAMKPHKTPLIVFTPKGLLRLKMSYSQLTDLTEKGFQDLFEEPSNSLEATCLVFTFGKVIYDLLEIQNEKRQDKAFVRVEKLYPFNIKETEKIIFSYKKLKKILLVQEEPLNMGAASFIQNILEAHFPSLPVEIMARSESASTAAGSLLLHQFEQQLLLKAIIEA